MKAKLYTTLALLASAGLASADDGDPIVDVTSQISTIQGYAVAAITAGVALAGAWMGWKFVKRFIRG